VLNDTWNVIFSEFLINLAAGWFGAVFITPNFSKKKKWEKVWVLIVNLGFATLCLWLASYLRS